MVSSIYLGIGSNLGDRYANIRAAVELMGKIDGLKVKGISSLYETEPCGGPPQGKFLNGVIEVETQLSPRELLEKLKEIERRLGRVKTVANGPRTIDLDILLYQDLVVDEEDLKIPHPRVTQRRFALEPLAELNPDLIHPISNKKVAQLLREVQEAEETKR